MSASPIKIIWYNEASRNFYSVPEYVEFLQGNYLFQRFDGVLKKVDETALSAYKVEANEVEKLLNNEFEQAKKRINRKLTLITFLGLMIFLISCNSSRNSNVSDNNSTIENDKEQVDKTVIDSNTKKEPAIEIKTQTDLKASEFITNLKNGEKLSSFFNEHWIFMYHEDNRCDGSTDGQIDYLKNIQIDSIIKVQVKNDGDGWACDKKEPKTFDLDFDLKKKIADWDRFEIDNDENENIVYIVGRGVSDYLKLHYNNNNLIIKLEYRSEDPG